MTSNVIISFKISDAYISDNGEFINIYIYDQINSEFYENLFGVSSFYEIPQSEIEGLNESIETDLNLRIFNIVNQLRTDNKGRNQPLRIFFLNEKHYLNNELSEVLVEDKYKDEPYYVDFLCYLHSSIQQKLS